MALQSVSRHRGRAFLLPAALPYSTFGASGLDGGGWRLGFVVYTPREATQYVQQDALPQRQKARTIFSTRTLVNIFVYEPRCAREWFKTGLF